MDYPEKNIRAPLLCYFKLFASFHSHWWIQTGVTVWKRLIWVKIDDFFSRVALQFDGWPWKSIGHLFHATLSSQFTALKIGWYTFFVTLSYDLDLGFSRSNFENAVSQEWEGQLTWNQRDVSRLNVGPMLWLSTLTRVGASTQILSTSTLLGMSTSTSTE